MVNDPKEKPRISLHRQCWGVIVSPFTPGLASTGFQWTPSVASMVSPRRKCTTMMTAMVPFLLRHQAALSKTTEVFLILQTCLTWVFMWSSWEVPVWQENIPWSQMVEVVCLYEKKIICLWISDVQYNGYKHTIAHSHSEVHYLTPL
jgi:hypothetical protein